MDQLSSVFFDALGIFGNALTKVLDWAESAFNITLY